MTETKTTLYHLAAEYRAIQDEIEALDGELLPDLEARLDAVTDDLPAKVEACQFVYRARAAEAEAQQARANAYHAQYVAPYERRAKTAAADAARLRAYVQRCMEIAGFGAGARIATEFGGARLQKNSQPSVTCTVDPATLPAPLQRVIVDMDAAAVRALAAAGGSLPEGVSVTTGTHLRWL